MLYKSLGSQINFDLIVQNRNTVSPLIRKSDENRFSAVIVCSWNGLPQTGTLEISALNVRIEIH